MNWPVLRPAGRRRPQQATPGTPQETPEERNQKALEAIYSLFTQAKAYAEAKPAIINLRFDAMKGLFDGSKKLFVNADGGKEITQAVVFAKKLGISLVIVGGKDRTW